MAETRYLTGPADAGPRQPSFTATNEMLSTS